jgi:hypothetical protein
MAIIVITYKLKKIRIMTESKELFTSLKIALSGHNGEPIKVGKPASLVTEFGFNADNAKESLTHLRLQFGNKVQVAHENPTLAQIVKNIPELTEEYYNNVKKLSHFKGVTTMETLENGEECKRYQNFDQWWKDRSLD